VHGVVYSVIDGDVLLKIEDSDTMPKFFGKSKGNKARSKKAEESPLFSNESKSESKSSSKSSAFDQRQARRKERQAESSKRKQQRDKRDQEQANAKAKEEAKKKKRSKPKLSQAEQDAQDAKLGCCHKFAQLIVKIVHGLDLLIGLTFLVYGGLIFASFSDPAMEAVITSLTFGSVMVFTSILGGIGFISSKCKRCGLTLSAWTAPFIAFFYLFVIIAIIGDPDTYFNYLTEHQDVMYLNDAEILTMKNLAPLFCIILGSLAAVELCRFFVLRGVRRTLVRYDGASSRILASQRSTTSKRSKGSSTSSRTSGYDDDLSEPLIGSDEEV